MIPGGWVYIVKTRGPRTEPCGTPDNRNPTYGQLHRKHQITLFSTCLISGSVKGSNVSIMDLQNSSTNGIHCDKVLKGNIKLGLI